MKSRQSDTERSTVFGHSSKASQIHKTAWVGGVSVAVAAAFSTLFFASAVGRAADSTENAVPPSLAPAPFAIQSADGDLRLKLHGYVQADGRFYLDNPRDTAVNNFVIRRARPILDAALYDQFDARIMPDFGGGQSVLQDAYLDIHPAAALRLRVGKFKPPSSLLRLQDDVNAVFAERPVVNDLVQDRDVGAQLWGDLGSGVLSYSVGVFDGAPDGQGIDGDSNDGKDLAWRVFAQPFKPLAFPAIRGFGFGYGATDGKESGSVSLPNLPTYKSVGQQTFFTYLAGSSLTSTVLAAGRHRRSLPQAYYYWGPVGVMGEYAESVQEVRKGSSFTRLYHRGWQATGSVVLGGDAAYGGVVPQRPWAAKNNGWGALELKGRYGELRLDNGTFPTFADPTASANRATDWGVGLNWHLNAYVRMLIDYDRTTYRGGGGKADRLPEEFLLNRFQVMW